MELHCRRSNESGLKFCERHDPEEIKEWNGASPMSAVASAVERVLTTVADRKSAVDRQAAIPATGGSILDREDVKAVWAEAEAQERICVHVAAENRVLRETLGRMLSKRAGMEVADWQEQVRAAALLERNVDVLVLILRGDLEEDLATIREVHSGAEGIRILLVGTTRSEGEFLQCVRAGIRGFLFGEASGEDVLSAIRAVHAGEAVCPGSLSAALFRYFEREASDLPCAGVQQRLGFTRREQQLIPLIAKGLTNKDIANHFCLSEQTVKNHLYRMKHKIGAEDRLSIVQMYRTQGFLL
jgi:DNA-binding NarL/FixJ family response regulator